MRDSYERRQTSVLTWLISSIVAVYVMQSVVARVSGFGVSLENTLVLSTAGLRAGHLWTLLTYGFLHDTDNLLQVIAYLLAIYFAGRELLPMLGARRFLAFYGSALVAGGLCWSALHWGRPGGRRRRLRRRLRARRPLRLLLPKPGNHAAPLLPADQLQAQAPRLPALLVRPVRPRVLRDHGRGLALRGVGPFRPSWRDGGRLALLPLRARFGLGLQARARRRRASPLDEAPGPGEDRPARPNIRA